MQHADQMDEAVAAARAGDEAAFSGLVERYRPELQVHCYRMLGSFEDSEDLTQETFLRAWRKRTGFKGRSTFRAWLDLPRLAVPDCDERLPRRAGEAAAACAAAVLILRDVLGWSAKDTASLLETSVASVNSALQRARATLKRRLPVRRLDWAPESNPTSGEQALVKRYIEATERLDTDALLQMLSEDARFSMPPEPGVWVGRDTIVASWLEGGFGCGDYQDFRCILTHANRQPAVAAYVRRPGDSEYRALAVDLLRIEDEAVAEIITFGPDVFATLGLPPKLSA
jgi:RNA polymerase sigma-70 factor, ECF subfamily